MANYFLHESIPSESVGIYELRTSRGSALTNHEVCKLLNEKDREIEELKFELESKYYSK
jgi:hypothetical protein